MFITPSAPIIKNKETAPDFLDQETRKNFSSILFELLSISQISQIIEICCNYKQIYVSLL